MTVTIQTPNNSPALRRQEPGYYPARYEGRVPLRIRMTKTVCSDIPFGFVIGPPLAALVGQELDCWVNSLGAVAAIFPDGQALGVKPDEFEVIAYHGNAAAGTNVAGDE